MKCRLYTVYLFACPLSLPISFFLWYIVYNVKCDILIYHGSREILHDKCT